MYLPTKSALFIRLWVSEAVTIFSQKIWYWEIVNFYSENPESVSYTLVKHVCLISEGCVLAEVLSDHLHPLQLQPL